MKKIKHLPSSFSDKSNKSLETSIESLKFNSTSSKNNKIFIFLSGIITALAFPPFNLWFVVFFTISYLCYVVFKSNSLRQSFIYGWFFGFGFLGCGLYWISNALLTDSENFSYLIPFALILIPAILAIYYGLCCVIVCKYKNDNPIVFIIFFAAIWTWGEIARTYLFTGFPWLKLGYIYGITDHTSQLASITGIFGLSFLGFITSSILFIILICKKTKKINLFVSFIILINFLSFSFGYLRLNQQEVFLSPKIRIIQPKIDKFHGWTEYEKIYYLNEFIKLSEQNFSPEIKYIIWPETALPLNLFNPFLLEYISSRLPNNITLISNSLRMDPINKLFFNSSIFTQNANILGFYDKSHLVPFGEYIPFRRILPLQKITSGSIDFSKGQGVQTYEVNELKFSILICYESFFPGQVINRNNKPDIIINITNDAWYGNSSGPYQHFQMTKFRAIEEGIPIIRAANNGISAFIDSFGRVLSFLPLDEKGYIDHEIIPQKKEHSFYSQYRKMSPLLLLIILVLIIGLKINNNDLSKS